RTVKRLGWFDRRQSESLRLRIGVGVVCWIINGTAARPKSAAANLVGVGFAGDSIGKIGDTAGMLWSGPAGKSRDGQVWGAPKEMHRTALADEARAKDFKNAIALQKHTPKTIGVFTIVGSVSFIPIERYGIGDLVGFGIDLHG